MREHDTEKERSDTTSETGIGGTHPQASDGQIGAGGGGAQPSERPSVRRRQQGRADVGRKGQWKQGQSH